MVNMNNTTMKVLYSSLVKEFHIMHILLYLCAIRKFTINFFIKKWDLIVYLIVVDSHLESGCITCSKFVAFIRFQVTLRNSLPATSVSVPSICYPGQCIKPFRTDDQFKDSPQALFLSQICAVFIIINWCKVKP